MGNQERIILWCDAQTGACPVADFIGEQSAQTQGRILKKTEYFQKLSIHQLKEHDFLDRAMGVDCIVHELKYKISPPFRMICLIWKDSVIGLKMFQGSGSNGKLPKSITAEVIRMAEDWKLRFP